MGIKAAEVDSKGPVGVPCNSIWTWPWAGNRVPCTKWSREGRLQFALEKSSLAGRRGLGGRGEGADWGQEEVQALVMSRNGRQGLKQVNGRVEGDEMDSRST